MIAIVDYGVGNIRSVANALRRAGARELLYTGSRDALLAADKVILPGVGDASWAMEALRSRSLDSFIPTLRQPVLGICVGAQLMCRSSEEGNVRCMDIFHTDVRRFVPQPGLKIPHMGWNSIAGLKGPLFKGLEEGGYVYFVHSYYPEICPEAIATARYGTPFCAALGRDNFYACQFHPEKSGAAGARILENFLAL